MSRHARTSPASSVLKLCNDTSEFFTDAELQAFRSKILDNPDISDDTKSKIIDMATIILMQYEQYRFAASNLQKKLDSVGVELE